MNITVAMNVFYNLSLNQSQVTTTKPLLSDLEKVLFTAGLIILSLLTIFGNTLVIVAFITYRPLRSVTNYFIVSLSISDILVAVISMPVWITFVILNMNFKIHEGKLLKAWTCFDIMTGIASILNLVAVSVDRYLHINKPLTYQKLVTRQRVLKAILGIWIFSISLSLVKGFHWRWKKPNFEMTIFTIGFALPLTVIIYCYLKIYGAVRVQLTKHHSNSVCINGDEKKKTLKTEMKAVKSIALVVFAFFICWCPFFILNLIHGFCHCRVNHHIVTFAKWLHYSNSVINPIIYACFNGDYRKGFQNALWKHFSTNENTTIQSFVRRTSFPKNTVIFMKKGNMRCSSSVEATKPWESCKVANYVENNKAEL